jgi:hypothetical protein
VLLCSRKETRAASFLHAGTAAQNASSFHHSNADMLAILKTAAAKTAAHRCNHCKSTTTLQARVKENVNLLRRCTRLLSAVSSSLYKPRTYEPKIDLPCMWPSLLCLRQEHHHGEKAAAVSHTITSRANQGCCRMLQHKSPIMRINVSNKRMRHITYPDSNLLVINRNTAANTAASCFTTAVAWQMPRQKPD